MTRGFHLSSSSMFFSLEHTARLGGGRVPGGGRSAGGRGRRVETKPRAEGVAAAASGLGHVPEARGRAPGPGHQRQGPPRRTRPRAEGRAAASVQGRTEERRWRPDPASPDSWTTVAAAEGDGEAPARGD
jgi:hypothetical protein